MSPALDDPLRLHRAARIEDRVHAVLERSLRRRGWRPAVLPFTGYGTTRWARVLARVLLASPDTNPTQLRLGRGWRRFLTAAEADCPVTIELGGQTHEVLSARGGYIDLELPAELRPGWAEAVLRVEGAPPVSAALRIVPDEPGLGVVSDIDDTVIHTALPRPLVAGWNTFVRLEGTRRPVEGMPGLFAEVALAHPDVPVFYVSTGPWNVASVLQAFLGRHGYPAGPLLMTDWGTTPQGWFRSGQAHKRRELRRLMEDLPQLEWLLVGDDGQHDPQIYAEVAEAAPDRVRAVAIRELSPGEQVRTHGTPTPLPEGVAQPGTGIEVRAPDGNGLVRELRARGVLPG